ncbi:phosphoglycerol transferase MdoB-like AlkP superfamily enzyme [Rummeliibacillus stabekisii]|nr:phosphoglycerol transferase MdoB-like AlkP superfamily enzyme [Rummeliibacillus stabekisii]GEL04860.1 hypothetical protein RST01_14870 [Rummeliibacillus stabekisii]
MLIFADILMVIATLLIFLSAAFYLRYLEKVRKQRGLTTFERTLYILIQIAYILFAISLLIRVFS